MASQPKEKGPKIFTGTFVLILLTNFSLFVSFHLFPSTLPLYARDLGQPEEMAGWLIAAATIASLVMRPIAGAVVDKRGRHGATVIGAACMIIAVAGFFIFPVFAALIVLRALQGMGWGVATTANATAATDTVPKPRFAEAMGYFATAGGIALALAPGIGVELYNSVGIQALEIVSLVALILAIVLTCFIQYVPLSEIRKEAEAARAANPQMEAEVKKPALIEKKALMPSMAMFFAAGVYGAILSFIAIAAEARGIEGISLFFVVYAIFQLTTRPLAGKLVDRKGYRLAVFVGLGLMLPVGPLIAFAQNLFMYLLAAVFMGVGFGSLQSSLSTMAVLVAPPERRGAANATFWAAFDAGISAAALLSGSVVAVLGYQGMFLSLILLPVISGIIFTIAAVKKGIK